MKEFNPETHALVEVSALNTLQSNLVTLGFLKPNTEYTVTEVVLSAVNVTEEIDMNHNEEYPNDKDSDIFILLDFMRERLCMRGFVKEEVYKMSEQKVVQIFNDSDYHDAMVEKLVESGATKSSLQRKKTKAIFDLYSKL